jgi:hypothetical protein
LCARKKRFFFLAALVPIPLSFWVVGATFQSQQSTDQHCHTTVMATLPPDVLATYNRTFTDSDFCSLSIGWVCTASAFLHHLLPPLWSSLRVWKGRFVRLTFLLPFVCVLCVLCVV